MRRQPYTECSLYVDGMPRLQVGDYIRTRGGSGYLVTEMKQSREKPHRRNLRCLRWPVDDFPADATVFELHWYPRDRKPARRTA